MPVTRPTLPPVSIADLTRAFAMTRAIMANVTPGQYPDPTPCASWDVRALVNHIVTGSHWYASTIRSGDGTQPAPTRDYTEGDVLAAYDAGIEATTSNFRASGALERTITLPFGEFPGERFLGLATSETFRARVGSRVGDGSADRPRSRARRAAPGVRARGDARIVPRPRHHGTVRAGGRSSTGRKRGRPPRCVPRTTTMTPATSLNRGRTGPLAGLRLIDFGQYLAGTVRADDPRRSRHGRDQGRAGHRRRHAHGRDAVLRLSARQARHRTQHQGSGRQRRSRSHSSRAPTRSTTT